MLTLLTGTQTEISKNNITISLVLMASEIVQGFESKKEKNVTIPILLWQGLKIKKKNLNVVIALW
jgi:hypothetical protein